MSKDTDVLVKGATLYFISCPMRLPLKFGAETVTEMTCARVKLRVEDSRGRSAEGWGETPMAAAWSWPGTLPHREREEAMKQFCLRLAEAWAKFSATGHPMEIGHAFLQQRLDAMLKEFNRQRQEPMPHLAALVCCSLFDIALHDAYGILHGVPTYQTYTAEYMNADLSQYLTPAEDRVGTGFSPCKNSGELKPALHAMPAGRGGAAVSFSGLYPADFLVRPRKERLPVWHLVGGKDLLEDSERTGAEPDDGYPVVLREWVRADGLKCLKIKLRGNDAEWDYERVVRVGHIAVEENVSWLQPDFNCMVKDPGYVNDILDRLLVEHPRLYGMILYVEQPFPYDLEANRIDVHSLSARKPLFMDESAHDWKFVKMGRDLGWTGVALKTCKTQTGALLSLCWAKAHGMTLMVQDLTNPMLAQLSHVQLAAHAGTIMGVESNGMQFAPAASDPEARVHPGLYRRRQGVLDLSTMTGPGIGYRLAEIPRRLPAPAMEA